MVFDEICANFLTLSKNRQRIKKDKKKKFFSEIYSKKILNSLTFNLTNSQKHVLNEINIDFKNNKRMFRIIQGDVGSGKTIVSLLSITDIFGKISMRIYGPTKFYLNIMNYKKV